MNEQTIVPQGDVPQASPAEITSKPSQLREPSETLSEQPEMYSDAWVEELVSCHAPDQAAIDRITAVRAAAALMMKTVIKACPDCGDRGKALEHIRQAMFHSSASIVLNALV